MSLLPSPVRTGSDIPVLGSRPGEALRAALAGPRTTRLSAWAWSRAETLGASASLLLAATFAALSWLVAGLVVPWDSKNHFYAMFRFVGAHLARGEWPLWNPYHFAGHPAVADPQSLLFTPSLAIPAALAPHASMQVFDLLILGHLLVGAFGVLLLCRRRGHEPIAAVLGGLVFMLGGAVSSRLQHTGMVVSYAFFPLALLALEALIERARWRDAVLFGLAASLMALGRDQVAFLFCLTLILRLVHAAICSRKPLRFLRERIGPLVLAGFIGAAVLAVPSLLTLQFLGGSNRPGISYGVAAAGSLAPVNLITLFAPNIFGSLDWSYHYWGPGYETMSEADWTDRAVNYLFAGTVPALLLFWHGVAGARLFARENRFVLLALAGALLFALGRATPVFNILFDWVPGVSLYRRPADATFAFNAAFAFASAYLLHRYIRAGIPNPFAALPRPAGILLVLASLFVLAAVSGAALRFSWNQKEFWPSLQSFGLAVACCGLGAAILIAGERTKRRAFAAAVLVAITGGELIWRNAANSMNAEPASQYTVYAGLTPAEEAGLAVLRRELAAREAGGAHPRVEMLGLAAWGNASMVLGIENTLGYNPLRISDYERAVGPGENAGDPNLRHFPDSFRGYKCRLARLLGIDYLVLDRPMAKLPRHVPRPIATLLYAGEGFYIYKIGPSVSRAYLADRVRPIDTEQTLSEHSVPEFDRSAEALVDARQASRLSRELLGREPARASAGASSATIQSYEPTRIVLSAGSERGGLLVLHDLFYPGWQATVDGVPVPVVKANVLFRGVEVPPGQHEVVFTFRPFAPANLLAAAEGLLKREEE